MAHAADLDWYLSPTSFIIRAQAGSSPSEGDQIVAMCLDRVTAERVLALHREQRQHAADLREVRRHLSLTA